MKRSETRYKRVWDAGYMAGLEEATSGLVRTLGQGYDFAVDRFGGVLLIRTPDRSRVLQISSLGLLDYVTRKYEPDQASEP